MKIAGRIEMTQKEAHALENGATVAIARSRIVSRAKDLMQGDLIWVQEPHTFYWAITHRNGRVFPAGMAVLIYGMFAPNGVPAELKGREYRSSHFPAKQLRFNQSRLTLEVLATGTLPDTGEIVVDCRVHHANAETLLKAREAA